MTKLTAMQKGYITRQKSFASVYKAAIEKTEKGQGVKVLWDGVYVDRQGLRDWLTPLLHHRINLQGGLQPESKISRTVAVAKLKEIDPVGLYQSLCNFQVSRLKPHQKALWDRVQELKEIIGLEFFAPMD